MCGALRQPIKHKGHDNILWGSDLCNIYRLMRVVSFDWLVESIHDDKQHVNPYMDFNFGLFHGIRQLLRRKIGSLKVNVWNHHLIRAIDLHERCILLRNHNRERNIYHLRLVLRCIFFIMENKILPNFSGFIEIDTTQKKNIHPDSPH